MASIINATTTNGVAVQGDNSGSLQLQTNSGTTAVTIDTSQNATFANSVLGTASTFQVGVNTSGKDARFGVLSGGNGRVEFYSAGSEQMRIATDGTISTTIGSTLYGAYPARAWVNFNGTGTPAIRTSRNVSSITDNGTGDYTINFTQAMPDTEYSVAGAVNEGSTDNALPARIAQLRRTTPTTSSFRVGVSNLSNSAFDVEYVFFQVFR